MVGAVRFELTTSCTRNKRATRLRYAPTLGTRKCRVLAHIATEFSGQPSFGSDARTNSFTFANSD